MISSRMRKILKRSITISIPCGQTHWSNCVWRQGRWKEVTGEKLWPNWPGLFDAGAILNRYEMFAVPNRKASDAKSVPHLLSS